MLYTIIALFSLSLTGLGAEAKASEDYSYDYLGEALPLELDTTRIAILRSGEGPLGTALQREASLALLTRSEEWTTAGWSIVHLAEGTGNDATIHALVREVLKAPEVEFASPIFLNEYGDVIMRPELLVRLESYNGETMFANVGDVVEIDASGIERAHRVRTDTKNGFEVLEIANALASSQGVEYAEPNMFMSGRPAYTPNDPSLSLDWGLNQNSDFDMDAPEAWDITLGDANIIVAVLDDGVQQDHPDLNQITGIDWTGQGSGGGPFDACDNHGTAVAGCISMTADNSIGSAGLAPSCKVIGMKFTVAAAGCGSFTYTLSHLASAIGYCASNSIEVTNNSNSFGPSSTITTAYSNSFAAGVIHFAATGNDTATSIVYPGSLSTVHAIGATERFGGLASFSNTGTGIGFTAPGKSIYTTDRTGADGYGGGDWRSVDGTSFASPYASAVAALMLSVDNTLSLADMARILEDSSTDLGAAGYDTTFGHGMVNAFHAVVLASCLDVATAVVRNGGTNPNVLVVDAPVLGTTQEYSATTAPYNLAWFLGYVGQGNLVLSGGQTVLVNLASPKLFKVTNVPGPVASMSPMLPLSVSLCGASFTTQAMLLGGATPFALTNAVDFVIGGQP